MAATVTPVTTDPVAFVAEAERITNETDIDAQIAVYTPDAVYEHINDGVHERHVGIDDIAAAWRVYMAVARDTGVHISKRLIAADGDTIANVWEGKTRGGGVMRGQEYWRLTEDGRVREHVMYGYINVKPSSSWPQRLRFFASSPRAALSFLRADRKYRGARR